MTHTSERARALAVATVECPTCSAPAGTRCDATSRRRCHPARFNAAVHALADAESADPWATDEAGDEVITYDPIDMLAALDASAIALAAEQAP